MADRYRQLFTVFPYATFLEDAAGILVDANAAAARLLNYPAEELIGRPHREFLTTASAERLLPQRQNLPERQRLQLEAQYIARGGLLRNVIVDISRLPSEGRDSFDGAAEGDFFLVVARESSRLDELERELRLQRQSAHARYLNDRQATFFISSRNEISPYPPLASNEEARPLDWVHALLLGPRLRAALVRAWNGEEVLLPLAWYDPNEPGGQTARPDDEKPAEKFATTHRARWLKFAYFPVRGRGAEITDICVQVQDCTADHLANEEQRKSDQRIASSSLTTALHHELNNFLSVILAQASGLRLVTPSGQLPPPHLGAIIDAAENAASVLRRSGGMIQHGTDVLAPVDLNGLAADCAHLLPHLVPGRISVEMDLAAGLPKVHGEIRALRTLLLELFYHAQMRVPQGGKLSLKTWRGKASYPGMPAPACLSLQDNTPRVPVAPTATTGLELQSGETETSLELALVRAILREHRGQLETVFSTLQGCVYDVSLPAIEELPRLTDPVPPPAEEMADDAVLSEQLARTAAEHQGALPAGTPPAATPPESRKKILLADDEENFLAFTSWVLKERGYQVVLAGDGQEAYERFQEAPQSFHLVILDAYMPRMGGLEAYLRMQVLRPDLPVLFASGFVRGPSVDALVEGCPGPAGVLLKPFSSDDLVKAITKALTPKEG